MSTTKNSTTKKSVTLTDSFLTYPHKRKRGGVLGSEGRYHFPKEEIDDKHKYSLTRTEYIEIVTAIFEEIFQRLLQGKKVVLPNRLGALQLLKYRTNRSKKIDWNLTNQVYGEHNENNSDDKKFVYHKNHHTSGYNIMLYWDKKKAMFTNRNMFKLKLVRSAQRAMAKYFKETPGAIYKLNTV